MGTARRAVARYGADVPLNFIAQEAGLTNASLYRHFSTREQLFAACAEEDLGRHLQATADAEKEAKGWEAFERIIRWTVEEYNRNAALPIMLRCLPIGAFPKVDALHCEGQARLSAIIDRAKADGEFRRDRWIEDVLLILNAHEALAGGPLGQPGGRRLVELLLDSVRVDLRPHTDQPPPSVIALRTHALDRLAVWGPEGNVSITANRPND